MAQNKEELRLELKNLVVSLRQLQQSNALLLNYLPKELKQEIKNASSFLKELPPSADDSAPMDMPKGNCDNASIVQSWLTRVIAAINSAKNTLEKGTQNYFKTELASKYADKSISSFNQIEEYLFGSICSFIVKNGSKTTFSDMASNISFQKDQSYAQLIATAWEKKNSKCLAISDLPKPDFLAKKIMAVYIDSAIDGFDIDPGEYTKIKAGYIYFHVEGKYEVIHSKKEGTMEGTTKFIEGNFDCAPVLDDVYGGNNAIKVLKDLYGAHSKLVDLPIKLKLNARLTIADPMDFYGGLAGYSTLVFDRDMSGNWVGVSESAQKWQEAFSEAEKKAKIRLDLTDFIENKLLSDFTLADLKSDGW